MKFIKTFGGFIPKLSCHTMQTAQFLYKNPCLELQRYLEIPLFKDSNFFSPNIESLCSSEDLFVPKLDHDIRVIRKAIHPERFPEHKLPEVAFIGRSNAGKSSLIAAILKNAPNLKIRTSKKPGHTKSVHFFRIGSKLCLIDLPGYGKNEPEWYEDVIPDFLRKRKTLVKTFVITDGDSGLQESDEELILFLESLKIPYVTILNKIDKAKDSVRLRNLIYLMNFIRDNNLLYCFNHPFMLSCKTYEGFIYFRTFLAHVTGNISEKA